MEARILVRRLSGTSRQEPVAAQTRAVARGVKKSIWIQKVFRRQRCPILGMGGCLGEGFLERTPRVLAEGPGGWSRHFSSEKDQGRWAGDVSERPERAAPELCPGIKVGSGQASCGAARKSPKGSIRRRQHVPPGERGRRREERARMKKGDCTDPASRAPTPSCGLRPPGRKSPSCSERPLGRQWWGPDCQEDWGRFSSIYPFDNSQPVDGQLRPRLQSPLLL